MSRFPLWAQYYVPLYLLTALLLQDTVWQILGNLQATNWLDADVTRSVTPEGLSGTPTRDWELPGLGSHLTVGTLRNA